MIRLAPNHPRILDSSSSSPRVALPFSCSWVAIATSEPQRTRLPSRGLTPMLWLSAFVLCHAAPESAQGLYRNPRTKGGPVVCVGSPLHLRTYIRRRRGRRTISRCAPPRCAPGARCAGDHPLGCHTGYVGWFQHVDQASLDNLPAEIKPAGSPVGFGRFGNLPPRAGFGTHRWHWSVDGDGTLGSHADSPQTSTLSSWGGRLNFRVILSWP